MALTVAERQCMETVGLLPLLYFCMASSVSKYSAFSALKLLFPQHEGRPKIHF